MNAADESNPGDEDDDSNFTEKVPILETQFSEKEILPVVIRTNRIEKGCVNKPWISIGTRITPKAKIIWESMSFNDLDWHTYDRNTAYYKKDLRLIASKMS